MEIANSIGRRRGTRVRMAFARDRAGNRSAPMGKLIAVGGRGGEVALKVYLVLLWLRPTAPAPVSPLKVATLIGLGDPAKKGARRVSDALRTLSKHRLLSADHRRGGPPRVSLLREDGRGGPYVAPRGDDEDYYFQIPAEMWTTGQLQRLSSAGLGMLLAIMSEQKSAGGPQWWSTNSFSDRIGLSPATRARGTRDLQKAGLLEVSRRRTARLGTLEPPQLRNIYRLTGAAVGMTPDDCAVQAKGADETTLSATTESALDPEEVRARLREMLRSLDEQPSSTGPGPTI
jgi:hypothetical protein